MNIQVSGGQVLSGEIFPSGSKNSAVVLISSSILFDKEVVFENIPDITDVTKLVAIMEKLGSKISWNKEAKIIKIDNQNLSFKNLDKDDLGNMKGTSLLWGPMLARFKKVDFTGLPRGCTLGFRSLGPHYTAFRDLGVRVVETDSSVSMDATKAQASEIWLTEMSPTVTENVLMLATGLSGTTRIIGAASEPQVQDVCRFLIDSGAKITGVGSSVLEIVGVQVLTPKTHRLLSDHYEIATFLALGALTGGKMVVHDALPGLFTPIGWAFEKFGVKIDYQGSDAIVEKNQQIRIVKSSDREILTLKAQPWPAIPVDTLPLFIPLALAAPSGTALFHNWMYESGLFWTSELQKLGANILICDPHRVLVVAGEKLKGGKLEAPYIIRATVAMVMAAMIASGESIILNADSLYRGHPHFSENLKKLGAKIEEVDK